MSVSRWYSCPSEQEVAMSHSRNLGFESWFWIWLLPLPAHDMESQVCSFVKCTWSKYCLFYKVLSSKLEKVCKKYSIRLENSMQFFVVIFDNVPVNISHIHTSSTLKNVLMKQSVFLLIIYLNWNWQVILFLKIELKNLKMKRVIIHVNSEDSNQPSCTSRHMHRLDSSLLCSIKEPPLI